MSLFRIGKLLNVRFPHCKNRITCNPSLSDNNPSLFDNNPSLSVNNGGLLKCERFTS